MGWKVRIRFEQQGASIGVRRRWRPSVTQQAGARALVGEGHGVARELDVLGLEERAEEEVLEVDVLLAPGLARDGLLRHEAGGRQHAQAAVRELLLLHLAELGRVLRREAERVEADLA